MAKQTSRIKNLTLIYGVVAMGLFVSSLTHAQVEDPLKNENPAAFARAKGMKTAGTAKLPRVLAVRVHHDMCPYCKQLNAELGPVLKKASGDPVLWITLDLTTEETQKQSAMLAAALGLDSLWTGDMTRMGSVTFVDGESRSPIDFYRPGTEGSLQASLESALSKKAKSASKRARKKNK